MFHEDNPDGQLAMHTAVRLAEVLLNDNKLDDAQNLHDDAQNLHDAVKEVISSFPDIMATDPKPNDDCNIWVKELTKWVRTCLAQKMFTVEKLSDPRTRNELSTNLDGLVSMCHSYIDLLFEKIKSRMEYSDLDGPSSWSEAPAESIFSAYKAALDGRKALSVKNTVSICRLMHDGPRPATVKAEQLVNKAAEMWKARGGLRFTTNDWQVRFISKLICKLKQGDNDNSLENDIGDDSD